MQLKILTRYKSSQCINKIISRSLLHSLVMILWMWLALVVACTPLSFPSLYLAYKLARKRFLASVFNQHIALMMVFAGEFSETIIPFAFKIK